MHTRNYAIAALAGLLLFAVCAIAWSTRAKPEAIVAALPTFDYAQAGSWAVRPKVQPPAVWEAGWNMDVLLLGAGEALERGEAGALIKRRTAAVKALSARAGAFSAAGPVYAPLLRADSLEADTAAAVSAYLSADNRGRAFVIATDRSLPASLAPVFATDPMLRERFGGVLHYGEDDTAHKPEPALACSRRYDAGEGCVARIDLRRSGGTFEIAGDPLASERLTSGFVSWLNDNASKLAEPLGDLEEIEIIEIQKPVEGE